MDAILDPHHKKLEKMVKGKVVGELKKSRSGCMMNGCRVIGAKSHRLTSSRARTASRERWLLACERDSEWIMKRKVTTSAGYEYKDDRVCVGHFCSTDYDDKGSLKDDATPVMKCNDDPNTPKFARPGKFYDGVMLKEKLNEERVTLERFDQLPI